MKPLKEIFKSAFIILVLTITTQIGGFVYILYKPFSILIKRKKLKKWKTILYRFAFFTIIYLLFNVFFIPIIAKSFNRTPLPFFPTDENPIKPASIIYCLSNRHYVSPEIKNMLIYVSKEMRKIDDSFKIVYMDANFPFLKGFPLLPHLSHNDGKKIDLAFIYKDSERKLINKSISILGYGICEEPNAEEFNQPIQCENQGYIQYNLIKKITCQRKKKKYTFDLELNSIYIKLLSQNKSVEKIFIEPHLKQRLGLVSFDKIRFHGCGAVRHDDHIHVQIK